MLGFTTASFLSYPHKLDYNINKMTHRLSFSANNSPVKYIIKPFTHLNFSPGSKLNSHFETVDDIYHQELSTFYNDISKKTRLRDISSSLPLTARKKPRSPEFNLTSNDPHLKHQRRLSTPDETLKTSFKSPTRPTSQHGNYCRQAKECISRIRSKNNSPEINWHRMSPQKKRLMKEDIVDTRNLRCDAIKNLMEACKRIPVSEEVNERIKDEKKYVYSWSKHIDSTTEILQNINYCDNNVLKHLFYFKKGALEDMYQDSCTIKSGNRQKPFKIKPKTKKHVIISNL